MGIDELVAEGTHEKHFKAGDDLQAVVMENRIPLLLKHYRNSMPDDARAKFDKLDEFGKIEALRNKHYVLPKEHADAFITDMALYVMKKHDPDMAKTFEKDLKTYRESTDMHAKAKASKRINTFHKAALMNMGFDWDTLEMQGSKFGFSEQLFNQATAQVGDKYKELWNDAYISQAKEKEINDYIKNLGASDKSLKSSELLGENYKARQQFVSRYVKAKKENKLETFKQTYHPYFK